MTFKLNESIVCEECDQAFEDSAEDHVIPGRDGEYYVADGRCPKCDWHFVAFRNSTGDIEIWPR